MRSRRSLPLALKVPCCRPAKATNRVVRTLRSISNEKCFRAENWYCHVTKQLVHGFSCACIELGINFRDG